jgi:branched-subunit amino acid ABC-type transport system permease component
VIKAIVDGLPVGCVYGLVAVGLVLAYKTSGVFNFAFGAQAFVSATVFYVLRKDHGWPTVPAALVAIVLCGVVLGLLLDRFIFRLLRSAAPLPKLVTVIGLMVGIPETVRAIFGTSTKNAPPSIAWDAGHAYSIGDVTISADELATVIATLLVVVIVTVLLRSTALGLQMRAVVESSRLVQLNGIDSDKVAAASWVLSSLLAALAGVLLAPLYAVVDANHFTLLIVAASAAAVFGRLSSLPLALVGGMVLGSGQQLVAHFLPLDSVLARNIRPSMPFIMLALLLLLLPGLRRREVTDPLAGVDPPPPAIAATYLDPRLARMQKAIFVAFLGAVALLVGFVISDYWVHVLAGGIALTTIFLSITIVTGLGGQISLCQASFAGLGAFTAGQLATRYDFPVYGGILVGALVAAALGVLIALPCLRLGGLYLALGTLAFALLVENTLFAERWLSGGEGGVAVPRPLIGSIDFAGDRAFFFFAFAVFAICGLVVIVVRRGTTGQYLAALRGSEVAASAIGINPVRAKLTAFGLSAAIAGAGGALYASYLGTARVDDYPAIQGLFWVLLVVTLGSRTVDGALNAGLSFVLLPVILEELLRVDSSLSSPIQFALFGFGAVTFVRHQEGIVEFQKRASIEWVNAKLGRWLDRRHPEPVPA